MCSVVNWQNFFPGFCAYHVGMALFFLGHRNIKHAYSTLESTSKKLEISEQKAILLLTGEQGMINLKYQKKSFALTQKRLEVYIFSYAEIVANRFNSDYSAGVGFFECIPSKQKPIIRIACPHGILIPFETSEVQEYGRASEIVDDYYKLANTYKTLYEELDL